MDPDQVRGVTQTSTVRILQTHDSAGADAPAEYERVVTNTTASTLGWDAMTFLRPLTPTRTADPLVFSYVDPEQGSGWLRLEGFAPADVQRIGELVQIEEISRVVGHDRIPKDDLTIGRAALLRTNNPWFMLPLGIVIAVMGVLVAAFPQNGADPVVSAVIGIPLVLTGVAVTVVGIIRTIWWQRARNYAIKTGQTLPPELRGGL